MFSNESIRNAEACRFCWMCRHICPVAGSTGNEAWTPRARGLMISMMDKGTEFTTDIADIMYKCSLCEACSNDCVTNFKPSCYTKEARTMALVQGLAPEGVLRAIENIQSTQNIYGESRSPEVIKAAAQLPDRAEILLYLGQSGGGRAGSSGISMMSLMKKAGVSFAVLKEEPASGAFLEELMGDTGDVQEQAQKAAGAIMATGLKTLVALNPHDACIFRDQYCQWGLLPGIEVTTATDYLARLIEHGKLAPHKIELEASLEDPCRLARGIGETRPVRDILAALGVKVKELFLHGDMTRCCGGPVLNSHSPSVVRSMVASRADDARRIGSRCIITACPDCQDLMSRYSTGGVEIVDLFALLDQNC